MQPKINTGKQTWGKKENVFYNSDSRYETHFFRFTLISDDDIVLVFLVAALNSFEIQLLFSVSRRDTV